MTARNENIYMYDPREPGEAYETVPAWLHKKVDQMCAEHGGWALLETVRTEAEAYFTQCYKERTSEIVKHVITVLKRHKHGLTGTHAEDHRVYHPGMTSIFYTLFLSWYYQRKQVVTSPPPRVQVVAATPLDMEGGSPNSATTPPPQPPPSAVMTPARPGPQDESTGGDMAVDQMPLASVFSPDAPQRPGSPQPNTPATQKTRFLGPSPQPGTPATQQQQRGFGPSPQPNTPATQKTRAMKRRGGAGAVAATPRVVLRCQEVDRRVQLRAQLYTNTATAAAAAKRAQSAATELGGYERGYGAPTLSGYGQMMPAYGQLMPAYGQMMM